MKNNLQIEQPYQPTKRLSASERDISKYTDELNIRVNTLFHHAYTTTTKDNQKQIVSGAHAWYVCSHARPTYCNVCREALSGVTSHGLSCEICKFKAHKRCAIKSTNNCKWTTLASIGKEIIEDEERNICMPHQWLEGNLPVNAKCSFCDKPCGSVLRMQDYRCLWCKSYVHTHCKESFAKRCNLGICRVSILPPTYVNTVGSDGFLRASKAPYSSPLVVFVNSKSGDNQGVKFLRKFKQLLNPAQVFDLINGGPSIGLRLFQKFDCFRVLVCGGDGSVGWVLKEVDALNLHKQCQIGVLPLGTGNDLARVLGWGAALDDDNQLPKLLESFERATTKMLDRWSIMTYEEVTNIQPPVTSTAPAITNTTTSSTTNISTPVLTAIAVVPSPTALMPAVSSNNLMSSFRNLVVDNTTKLHQINHLRQVEDSIYYHISNILQNENIQNLVESTRLLNEKVIEVIQRVNTILLSTKNVYFLNIESKTILLKKRLDNFYRILKIELIDGTSSTSPSATSTKQPPAITVASPSSNNNPSKNESLTKPKGSTNALSVINREFFKRNSISIPCRANDNGGNALSVNTSNLKLISSTSAKQISIASSIGSAGVKTSSPSSTAITPTTRALAIPKLASTKSSSVSATDLNTSEMTTTTFKISKLFRTSKLIIKRANNLKKTVKNLIDLVENYDFNTQQPIQQLVNNKFFDFDDDLDDEDDDENNEMDEDDENDDEDYRHFTFEIDDASSTNLAASSDFSHQASSPLASNKHHRHQLRHQNSTPSQFLNPHFNNSNPHSASLSSFQQSNSPHSVSNSPHSMFNDSGEMKFNLNKNCKLNCRHGAANMHSFDAIEINNENSILLCSKDEVPLPQQQQAALTRPTNFLNCNNLIVSAVNTPTQQARPQTLLLNSGYTNSSNANNDEETLVICSTPNSSSSGALSENGNIYDVGAVKEQEDIDALKIQDEYHNGRRNLTASTTTTNIGETTLLSASSSIINALTQSAPLACEEQSRVSTPSKLSTHEFLCLQQSKPENDITETIFQFDEKPTLDLSSHESKQMPQIRVINSENAQLLNNSSSDTPLIAFSTKNKQSDSSNKAPSNIKPERSTNNLFLSPISKAISNIQLSSSSSNNNLSVKHDTHFLGLPPSPSGYSSSGSCFSKTPLPSPRISKKYSKLDTKNSSYYLQLSRNGTRGISALSSTFRRRSRSKSSEKSSTPTSPSSPKFSFKYSSHSKESSSFGFVGQALLFNTDALCAPITPPIPVKEPLVDLFTEKAVMNNYFGIGLDAKVCLEFHNRREEHPEKCRSRIRNQMFYGLLGSKELLQRTFKNLEQKVLLECDGAKIPLRNVQGIVVMNIPSYSGGVNFWGNNSKDDNIFTNPSFDDKILEVVAVSGIMEMALSRVVSIKSNRIAQCRSVKIQILGNEGVPVQVDGEAWVQPPGFIYLTHKNRAQMLTRNKVFEQTLKTWSEKQKSDPMIGSLSKEEFVALQSVVGSTGTLIKRIKTASLRNTCIEQDLYGYANQASSNLDEISVSGKVLEKCLRQKVTDFLNSVRTLHVESSLFITEKAAKNCIDSEIIEKIQFALNELKTDIKKLNECNGTFQYPMDDDDTDIKRKSRFGIVQRYKKSKIKHKDDKELLKTLHGIPLEDWGPEEVSLWLESLNLTEYKAAFLRHDIRGTEIRNLERRDLRELGIVKVGHIKRILNATKEIPKRVTREKQSV